MLVKPEDSKIVDFFEEGHMYINRGTRRRYKSVTTLIHEYTADFDENFWSMYKAVEKLIREDNKFAWFQVKTGIKEFGNDWLFEYIKKNRLFTELEFKEQQEKILADWRHTNLVALDKGSKYHERQDVKAMFNKYSFMQGENRPLANLPSAIYKGEKRPRLSEHLPDGMYVELLMYNHEHQMAGQTDRCFIQTIDGIRYIDFDDYKTNRSLMFNNKYQQMKAPMNHLDSCNGSEYRLQLSMYAWIAEQYGYRPRRLTITHVTGTIREFNIFYFRNEINTLMGLRKKELRML